MADEFYQLKRIVPTVGTAKTKKEKKTKLPKFSKGSWKHAALACLKHAFVGKDTEDFHFVRNENLVVCLDPKKNRHPARIALSAIASLPFINTFSDMRTSYLYTVIATSGHMTAHVPQPVHCDWSMQCAG